MNLKFQEIANVAEANDLQELKEEYGELQDSIVGTRKKNYGVLGDSKSGKSSLINCLTGSKSVRVSMIPMCHEPIVYVPDDESGFLTWTELNHSVYLTEGLQPFQNPLWGIDAVIYILSAAAPLSLQDVNALEACLGKGIPCLIALNKLELLPEEERAGMIEFVKQQILLRFGSDDLILLDMKDPLKTNTVVRNALNTCEDSRETRESFLTIQFAQSVKDALREQLAVCKAEAESAQREKEQAKVESAINDAKWEKTEVGLNERKIQLERFLQAQAYELYTNAGAELNETAQKQSSVENWWKTGLVPEMQRKNEAIINELTQKANKRISEDRVWLIQEVNGCFGLNLELAPKGISSGSFTSSPTEYRKGTSNTGKAVSGLVLSTAALFGTVIVNPTNPAIAAIAYSLTGIAVLGTGFWTYYSSKESKEEQREIIQREIYKYVSDCREKNMKMLISEIDYCYEELIISMKEKQLINAFSDDASENTAISRKIHRITNSLEDIEGILRQMFLLENEDDSESL